MRPRPGAPRAEATPHRHSTPLSCHRHAVRGVPIRLAADGQDASGLRARLSLPDAQRT